MRDIHLYYTSLNERAEVLNFGANLGITTNGFGDMQANEIKENGLNTRLVKLTNGSFFAKIRTEQSDNIVFIENENNDYYHCDGLIADLRQLQSMPVLLANTNGNFVIALTDRWRTMMALIHSGWQGANLSIAIKAVAKIYTDLKIKPINLTAFIMPGVCQDEYQADQEIKSNFPDKYFKGELFNLKKVIIDQLSATGLQKKHIHSADICSCCAVVHVPDKFNQESIPIFHSFTNNTSKKNCVYFTLNK